MANHSRSFVSLLSCGNQTGSQSRAWSKVAQGQKLVASLPCSDMPSESQKQGCGTSTKRSTLILVAIETQTTERVSYTISHNESQFFYQCANNRRVRVNDIRRFPTPRYEETCGGNGIPAALENSYLVRTVIPLERTSPALPWRTTAQQMLSRGWRRCSTDECVVAGSPPCLVLAGVPSLPFAACVFCPCAPLGDQTICSTHLLEMRFPYPLALARSPSHRHPPHPRLSHRRCDYWPALLPAHTCNK